MTRWRKTALILKYLGPRWAAYRLKYALELRSGAVARRSPCRAWAEIPADANLPDWLRLSVLPVSARGWGDQCISEADGISLGQYDLFFFHEKHLGCPPNWHRNPFTGQLAPRGRHWSQLGDFNFGDIKAIWEPSRFGWVYVLVRAHARTGEARLAELFWKLFEDWCAQNPPNEGVNWKCGQEATFRLMAITLGLAQFGRLPSATEDRIKLFSRFVSATGQRIEANLDYALSQSNNHGVSECVGLVTASLVAPATVNGWRARGLDNLQRQLDSLIYAGGGFSQHSLIYHRVLLQDLCWLIALLRRAGQPIPPWLAAKTRTALEFLTQITDPLTGLAPLYGANDGAKILPLEEGAFEDMRGTLQAGWVLLDGCRVFPPGPWDEAAFWLTGQDPSTWPLKHWDKVERVHFKDAGFFQWCSGSTRLFFHCPTLFRHRPAQADMLHLDLTWEGHPIALDAGTYSYNTTEPFDGALAQATAHNVPMLAGREPLQKAGRFLYLPWPTGHAEWSEASQSFSASHGGYGKAAQVKRAISSPRPGVFVVVDTVVLRQPGRVRLHWLLCDRPWKFDEEAQTISTHFPGGDFTISWQASQKAASVTLVRADPASARGWRSLHYLALEPANSLELLFDVSQRLEVTTHFAPAAA
jgi:hypothetical protein